MMKYDPEKYKEKRERVLGVKKRGLSFGAWSAIIAVLILSGVGAAVVPKAVAFLSTRNLDDIIYKFDEKKTLSYELVERAKTIEGVKDVSQDKNGERLVVTFDRNSAAPHLLSSFFKQNNINAVLLNRIGHLQRISDLKEEAELETP